MARKRTDKKQQGEEATEIIAYHEQPSSCPACHKPLEAVTAIGSRGPPQEGSSSVCAYCGAYLKYQRDLSLRLMSEQEKAMLHPKQIEVFEATAAWAKERAARETRVSAAHAQFIADVRSQYRSWIDAHPKMWLEKNDCSRAHHLCEADLTGRVIPSEEHEQWRNSKPIAPLLSHPFVVKHDWARAFENAEGIEDGFHLPYPVCAFELRLCGRCVICIAAEFDDQMNSTIFVRAGDYWIAALGLPEERALVQAVHWQIRAICIALEAQVAHHAMVRAPEKLNAKRAREKKLPLLDYHVVDLSRRLCEDTAALRAAGAPGSGPKKRLHFRRGHWRHLDARITWVKWALVGNPDLGFIHQQYSL